MIPLILAPLLAKLAESGLNLLGNAVLNKGKDFVEEKLGVNLEDTMATEEGRYKLKQLEIDHEEDLLNFALENRKVDADFYRIEAADRDSARDMNKAIQESGSASWIAKTLPYWLDILIVGMTLLMVYTLFFKGVPVENKEIFFTAFGSLLAMCGTILNFHRGTSAQSRNKDTTIADMAKGALK